MSLRPGDATTLWQCPKALPSQCQPWVEQWLLGRAASPKGGGEGLVGKGCVTQGGREGEGLRHPSPALQDGVLSLLPASREQGSNSIWIWRPLAGAKAVGRQPGTGGVRVTPIPPLDPAPDPVVFQTSMKTPVCNRLGSQCPSGCSAGQGWQRHGDSLPSSFPKKRKEGTKSGVSVEPSLVHILSSKGENQRKQGAHLSSSSSLSSFAQFDPQVPPSLPEVGWEHPALGVRSTRAVLPGLTRVGWLPLASVITPRGGCQKEKLVLIPCCSPAPSCWDN